MAQKAQMPATAGTHLRGKIWAEFKNPHSKIGNPLLVLAIGTLWAGALVSVQLLPTAELAGQSRSGRWAKSGGSVGIFISSTADRPGHYCRHMGKVCLQNMSLFLPITAFLFMVAGIATLRKAPRQILPPLALLLVGLLMGLGGYNPLNWQIAKLPGFNLFRVPARWLVLYSLGAALLAGAGLDVWRERVRGNAGILPTRSFISGIGLTTFLMIFAVLAVPLTKYAPLTPEISAEYPTLLTLLGWLVELVVLWLLLRNWGIQRHNWHPERGSPRTLAIATTLLCTTALFFASRAQPYHSNPTTPETFYDVRPATARLQAFTHCLIPNQPCQTPPGRMLSLSNNFFDPGDMAEIRTIYAGILSPSANFDYTVAIKQKEISVPNLPLLAGLPSIDGFDGGVLPLELYTSATQLILPDGVSTTDGRLREHLPNIPEARWLDLFNAQYLITDRIGDDWREGVFFDLHHPVLLTQGQTVSVGYIPDFAGNELWLWADGGSRRSDYLFCGWGELDLVARTVYR